jgi:hypothetical protein
MIAALVPIWILGGAGLALLLLNMVTAGGTTSGDRIDPARMNQGASSRMDSDRSVSSPLR